jgi:hypothetical protein
VSYASPGFGVAFVSLVLALALAFPAAVGAASRRAGEPPERTLRRTVLASVGIAVWLAATCALAASGLLARLLLPPPLLVLLVAAIALTATLAFSRLGTLLARSLPLALLVGYQAFRIPVELLLHRGHVEGFVPPQMTYLGLNFDVLTGISALGVAWAVRARRVGRRGVLLWNVAGLLLLANIATIAALSVPGPFRVFANSPSNAWVRHAPWIWLPTVLVQAAFLGHLLVFRALRSRA